MNERFSVQLRKAVHVFAAGHFSQEDRPEALSQGVIAMARKAGFLT